MINYPDTASRINFLKCSTTRFKRTGVSTAVLGLTGALLSLSAAPALAANECGPATAGGGTINCTAAGNNYTAGINYTGLTGNQTINFDGAVSGPLTLNKVVPGPNTGVVINGTGNHTYNVLGTVNMTTDGRTGTPGVDGMNLAATGGTLTFNTSGGMLNLTVYGAGPDTTPGLTGIVFRGNVINADLSNSNIHVEGGNPNVINISAANGVQSTVLKSGNITMIGNSGNFPDYDAALEVDVTGAASVDTSAGTINVQASIPGARGLIASRTITTSATDGLTITAGNINVAVDNGMGVVALRSNTGGTGGSIGVKTVAGTSITATGKNSFGIELNNANGEVKLDAQGSVAATGDTSAAILALSKANGPVTVDVAAGASVQGGWMTSPLANGSYANQTPNAAVGVLLGAAGGTATLNNAGTIGAGTDRAIESLEPAVTPASVMTTLINNSGTITGTVSLGSGNDVLDNSGTFQLRGFADTNGDGTRDALRVAVTNFGAGNNQFINRGTLALLGDGGLALTLDNTGEYATGYTANNMAIGGAVQGQILNVQTFTNSGTIDLGPANAAVGDVLVISGGSTPGTSGGGTYVANGGKLILDTMLNQGSVNSASDMLVVDGTQLGGGADKITVINAGGTGGQTVGNGIELVRVLDSGRSAAGVFQLDGRLVSGANEYDLYQGGVGADAGDGNWYLRTLVYPPDNGGGSGGVTPTPPAPRVETGVYLRNMAAASTMFMHTLHDRLGEPQFTDKYQDETNGKVSSLWVRVVGNHTETSAGNELIDLDTDTTLVHLGGDLARWSSNGEDRWLFGLMGAYGQSDTDASAAHNPVANNGMRRTANGKVDGYSIGAYTTWYGNKDKPTGPYVDLWGQYAWFDNKVKGNGLKEESYDSTGWTVSVEGGYAFVASDGEKRQWMIEPQAQIAYNSYSADDHFERSTNTWVRDGDTDGVITRLGARLYSRNKLGDNGIQPFVEANWWYGSAKYDLNFNEQIVSEDTPDNTFELKAGLQGEIAKGWQLWGHISGRWGENSFSSYEGMVGVKHQF